MPFSSIDPKAIKVSPVTERLSKSNIKEIAIDPDSPPPQLLPKADILVNQLADKIYQAKENDASVMLAFGAHVVKNGCCTLLINLMEQGWITHLATQGAGSIHDWEFSYLGKSEEDVRANVETGTFGTWEETGKYISLAILVGTAKGLGYGESLGSFIQNDGTILPSIESLEKGLIENIQNNDPDRAAKADLLFALKNTFTENSTIQVKHPFKDYSIFGNAHKFNIPITVHPGIGYDIIYNNPFANGAAIGRASHTDFKIFTNSVTNLSNGVFMSVGSAIMAPQVFEKAMSLANNLLLQKDKKITNHSILVNDLQESTWDWSQGEPPKSSPDYYLRFLKSFYRMGGHVDYLALDNRAFLHNLYKKLNTK